MPSRKKLFAGFILLIIIIPSILLGLKKIFKNQPTKDRSQRIKLSNESDLEIKAAKSTLAGISRDSFFILTSKLSLKESDLRQSLKIIPEIPVKLRKKSENEWQIIPQTKLEKGKIYQFIIRSLIGPTQAQDLSWAFQVETPLKITGGLPGNQATLVPLNTPIEIYFNNPKFYQWEKYFEITPKTEGRFEKHQNTLVFIPKKLKPAQIYSIKIRKGLPLEDGSQSLVEDYSFQFETGVDNKEIVNRFHFSRVVFETNPESKPTILLDNWQLPANPAKAKIYQLTQEQFLRCLKEKVKIPSWSRETIKNHRCSFSNSNQPQGEFEAEIKRASEYEPYYLELPEPLSRGFWALELENPQTHPSQTLIEVSPLAWYLWLGDKESLFWILDLEKQAPASGAMIEIDDQSAGQTNNQGIIKTTTPEKISNREGAILKIKYGSKQVFSPIIFGFYSSWNWQQYGFASKNKLKADNFWSYLYLDRQLYLPDDKVNFWGLVKSRQGKKIKSVKAKLVQGSFSLWSDKIDRSVLAFIAEKEINLSSANTFTDSFELKNLPPDNYSLAIFVNDQLVVQKWFSIKTFQKPAYKIELKPEKLALWAGEKNTIKVKAQFWDKTPVAKTKLVWNCNQQSLRGEITTNELGEGEINLSTTFIPRYDYWPQHWTIRVHPKLPEEAEIEGSTTFFVFGPQIKLSGESNYQDGQGKITISAKKINLEDKQANPWSNDTQPAANLKTKISVYRYWYQRIEKGERYNPIEKIVEKIYSYQKKEEKILEQEVATDQQGRAEITFPAEEKKSYRIEVSAQDEQQKTARLHLYLYSQPAPQSYSEFTLSANKTEFDQGERVKLSLVYQGEPAPEGVPNYYLTFLSQNGKIFDYNLDSKNNWEFAFQEKFIPNIRVKAVWFNGKSFKETLDYSPFFGSNQTNLVFKHQTKELSVKIQPEKREYQPREKAKISFSVTDKNGQPQRTRILVSVVDQALTDLEAIQTPEFISTLYHQLDSGKIYSYRSHPTARKLGVEAGGGGGEVRGKFKNTVIFREIETDHQGRASLDFQLPDNITSWQITAIAVNKDLAGGDSQTIISVSKPIFVQIISNQEFLAQDQPKFRAISFGKIIKPQDQIHYTVKAPSLGIEQLNLTQTAFQPIEFSPQKLIPGEHQIEVHARLRGQTDALIKKIKVRQTRLCQERTEFFPLKEDFSPSWLSSKPVKFTVTDRNRGYWYPQLKNISREGIYGRNERVDRLAAQIKAKGLLKKFFQEELDQKREDLSRYQRSEGGYQLLPYSSSDLILSAKIAALNLAETNREKLKRFFWKQFNKTDSIETASAALWGLAELKEPVLTIINQLEKEKNTPKGKIYLALAASALGSQTVAKRIWTSLLNQYGRETQAFIYLEIDSDKNAWIKNTSLAAVLAARVNSDLLEKMLRYLDNNRSLENIFPLERVLIIQSKLNNSPPTTARFEYQLAEKLYQEELADGRAKTILVSPEEISHFKIKPQSGSLGLVLQRCQPIDWQNLKTDSRLAVNLNLSPGSEVNLGDIIEIKAEAKIDSQAPSGFYQIKIHLPSGLRFVDVPHHYQPGTKPLFSYNWPLLQEGNTLIFFASSKYPIRFLARPINKGKFIFEPTLIYHQLDSDLTNFSTKPANVTIR